jgi:RNA-directed DNA polymerase
MSEICIEFYYKDGDIIRPDKKGKRLYLSNEFNPNSGFHLSDTLICKDFHRLKGELKIIDNHVLDREGNPVTISKDQFADNVLKSKPGFENIDFSGFMPLFEKISMIISDSDSSEE